MPRWFLPGSRSGSNLTDTRLFAKSGELLAQNLSITSNKTLSAIRKASRWGFIQLSRERATAEELAETAGLASDTPFDDVFAALTEASGQSAEASP